SRACAISIRRLYRAPGLSPSGGTLKASACLPAPPSVALRDKVTPAQRRGVVILMLAGTFRQLRLVMLELLVRDQRQNAGNAIQSRPLLVVGSQDVPGRVLGVGGFQHHVAGFGE